MGVVTVAGTSFAIAVQKGVCWVFDSHGTGGSSSGAYAKSSWDIIEATKPLLAFADSVGTQTVAHLNMFLDGLSFAPPPLRA